MLSFPFLLASFASPSKCQSPTSFYLDTSASAVPASRSAASRQSARDADKRVDIVLIFFKIIILLSLMNMMIFRNN